jgi:dienelactone hydrolase
MVNGISKLLILSPLLAFIACQTIEKTDKPENSKVGTTYFIWEDQDRLDTYYGGNRLVNAQLWYPTEDTIGTIAPYYYEIEDVWESLSHWNKTDIKAVQALSSNALVHAKASNTKEQPLIVFSPSLGGNLSQYSFYAERLAKAGYFVLGLNHLYESEYVITTNKQVKAANHSFHDSLKTLDIPTQITADEYRSKKGIRQKVLGEDILFAIGQLKASEWKGFIDFDQVGVFGHSIGGAGVIYASILDSTLKAVINLDGTPPSIALENGIDVPYLFIEDLTDYNNHTGYQKLHQRRNDFCQKNRADAFRILIGGIHHNSFLDVNYHLALSQKEKQKALATLEMTNDYMLDFFDHYLKNQKTFEVMEQRSDALEIWTFPATDLAQ